MKRTAEVHREAQAATYLIQLTDQRLAERLLVGQRFAVASGAANSGGPGGRPAPLASRLHRIPNHVLLNLHEI